VRTSKPGALKAEGGANDVVKDMQDNNGGITFGSAAELSTRIGVPRQRLWKTSMLVSAGTFLVLHKKTTWFEGAMSFEHK